jgi:endonuclease/exonuclease/phosphatase family metal-dependent hydrolase
MKKIISLVTGIILIMVIGAGSLIAYLAVSEFSPEEVESLTVQGHSELAAPRNETIRIMTWNLGYGALGDNADFFMDGGRMVNTADAGRVYDNLDDMVREIDAISPDIFLTQEIDLDSARSHFVDESDYLINNSMADLFGGVSAFATNFKVAFVPLPLPPIGKVLAGIEIFSRYAINEAERVSLPCPFKWPLRTFNLKRCLEISRIPVAGSDKELVIINLHLEAYDSGEGKIAQTKVFKNVLRTEVDAGNYVIAGGDFNQVFSNIDTSAFPHLEGKWQPGMIDVDEFGDDLTFVQDSTVPSCRSLDRVLLGASGRDPEDFQYYVIDGFIVSSNIEIEDLYADDLEFVSSDHNPLIMDFKLK